MSSDVTSVLAIYGAVLSTLAILLDITRYVKDRPKVVVEADHHVLYTTQKGVHKLGIKVTNKGTRPATVEACGFTIDSESEEKLLSVLDRTLPKRLDEGESHTAYADPAEVQASLILFAWVRDATGRVYKSKKRPFQLTRLTKVIRWLRKS
jgi:hypothetical protein